MTTATDTTGTDLTLALVFLLIMVVVSFIAGYGVAYIRMSKRRNGE
jgi:hypothetical protein